ncbi:MAG: N-acetylmuramoyl-L-alanine amidase family protein [Lachnospiraceae bacterium]|nr:N-acetylmuramoyl-L-alanine amidase family protein [Lachnospiraceae bacterium]
MVRKIKKQVALLVALGLLCMPIEAMAATKPINSVSVKVSSKLESGKSLPDIQIGTETAEDGQVVVGSSGDSYTLTEAEWVDKNAKTVQPSDEPRIKVTLEPTDVSERYFLASYKASSVKVSGGSFVSARRDGDSLIVTLRVKPVKGEYDPPADAYWNEKNLGEARWEKPENDSGYYELQLYRDGKSVQKVAKTTAKNYNFYPYMTKEGEYTFKIRTIPGTDTQNKYGKKSDWIESGELEITDRYVSDGKGQQSGNSSVVKGTTDPVGWFKEQDRWGYRYPDGNLCRDGWSEIDGLWYYFNEDGVMATGWKPAGGQQYYLYDNGQMAVGWSKVGGSWYYFRPEAEGTAPKGSMLSSGWHVIGTYYYYFNTDGSLYTGWLKENGKTYYLNELDNSLMGVMFTGWIRREEKTYFADSNGEILEGWNQIDGNWHYFYPGTGEMARNTQVDGFPIDSDGIWR